MNHRFKYLSLRRGAIIIQRAYKSRYAMRQAAAIQIQKNWRMYKQRKQYIHQLKSIISIQRWSRDKSDRFKFLLMKRSVPIIQRSFRIYLSKRMRSAMIIQRQFRMRLFRNRMNRYKNAAVTIQRWHRQMQPRYEFLKMKLAICKIQMLYRNIYMVRRQSAAMHIQKAWRVYSAKRVLAQKRIEWIEKESERLEEKRLNDYAARIQAWWRGYSIRKQNNQIISSIRDRLSIYVQTGSVVENSTLGARIRNSLNILVFQSESQHLSIQQIIIALIDLEKVYLNFNLKILL
jgi:hypothetical protein